MASEGFTTDEDDDLAVLEFVAKEPAEALGIERCPPSFIWHIMSLLDTIDQYVCLVLHAT